MANKKELTHESLMSDIEKADEQLKTAREAYKGFCKLNPLELKPQPTLHELRLMRAKNDKTTLEDHQKSNKAAASAAQKEQLKQELRGS